MCFPDNLRWCPGDGVLFDMYIGWHACFWAVFYKAHVTDKSNVHTKTMDNDTSSSLNRKLYEKHWFRGIYVLLNHFYGERTDLNVNVGSFNNFFCRAVGILELKLCLSQTFQAVDQNWSKIWATAAKDLVKNVLR